MQRSVCRDDSHRWQIIADVCGPSAALARFHKDHEELPDGLMLGVRLLADGEEATDPIRALELADLAAVRARHSASEAGGPSVDVAIEADGAGPR